MRLITAITEWLQADTTLKRIAAQTAELADYARGYQDGYEQTECVCAWSEADEE